MTTLGATNSNLQAEIDREYAAEEQDNHGDAQHENTQETVGEEQGVGHEESPGKILIQSVSEILAQSAQSVKALVSGNGSPTSAPESREEKTLLQSVGEKVVQSAQSVKEAVSGSSENDTDENGEEKGLLQSVGERIVQSAKTVKDVVNGNTENITTDEDETGEASILVHSILD